MYSEYAPKWYYEPITKTSDVEFYWKELDRINNMIFKVSLDEALINSVKHHPEKYITKICGRTLVPKIKDVRYDMVNKTTVIFWEDNTKTHSHCQEGDNFDPYVGFCLAFVKKVAAAEATKWVKKCPPPKYQNKVKYNKSKE